MTCFNAVHLTSSPLLGIKELNKYPNAIAFTKSNFLGLYPRGLINNAQRKPLKIKPDNLITLKLIPNIKVLSLSAIKFYKIDASQSYVIRNNKKKYNWFSVFKKSYH